MRLLARLAYNSGLHCARIAGVAQLVERNLAKVEVESSRLFSRSRFRGKRLIIMPPFSLFSSSGGVAEWLCSGLQSRGRRFDSDPRLQFKLPAARPAPDVKFWRTGRVVKLVYTRDLKSLGASHTGSSPVSPTTISATI